MPDQNRFDALLTRELETMAILLQAKVAKSAITLQEYIQVRLAQGSTLDVIKKSLEDDLLNNGRLFGELRSSIKSTATGSLNKVRDAAYYSDFEAEEKYRWAAVLVNTCPDCLSQHGLVKTWDEWETSEYGLPRSGGTICRDNCKCVLVPEDVTELQPLYREKK